MWNREAPLLQDGESGLMSQTSQKMMSYIPREYAKATEEFMALVVQGLIGKDPMIGRVVYRKTRHRLVSRHVINDSELDMGLERTKIEIQISMDSVRDGVTPGLTDVWIQYAGLQMSEMKTQMFRRLDEITQETGQSVDGGGRPPTPEQFLKMIESAEAEFDDEGCYIPKAFLDPSGTVLQAIMKQWTAQNERRLLEIIEIKKEKWIAERRTRRLRPRAPDPESSPSNMLPPT
jgi:hypothetical protein